MTPQTKMTPDSLKAAGDRALATKRGAESVAATAEKKIKLRKFYATNGVDKARVRYWAGTLIDGRECVTIYAKDYGDALDRVFPDLAINDTDIRTDYFDKSRVRIFPSDALYPEALARAEGR